MTTKATPVLLGPFVGGLNTFSDPSTIADDEVSELVNLDIDLDGTLVSRPAVVQLAGKSGVYGYRYLGNYTNATSTYLIYSAESSTNRYTLAYNTFTEEFTTITPNFRATAIVEYGTKLYLISPFGEISSGGRWDGTTFVIMPLMPRGFTACVYKERIFIGTGSLNTAYPSRVYFSNPAGAMPPSDGVNTWTGDDFFDVRNGDGQPIEKLYVHHGVIGVFKSRSTFTFAYESAPLKGQVVCVNAINGLDCCDSLVELENILYVMSNIKVYSINNWNWERINDKVPLKRSNSHTGHTDHDFSMSVIGLRIMVRYYDTHYVFNVRNKAWTTWKSSLTPERFIKYPHTDRSTGVDVYFAGNYLHYMEGHPSQEFIFRLKDETNSLDKESFDVKVVTKAYNFTLPYAFKRLMWWGVELLANHQVTATVMPSPWSSGIRWRDIEDRGLTWADRAPYTWGRPNMLSVDVTDSANISNFDRLRLFVKFRKSLRFRQVMFKLHSSLDGSSDTGPFKIFSMTIFLVHKQTVSKRVT